MRILWMSGGPAEAKTGYGQQTALTVPKLIELGHEIAIYPGAGLIGAPRKWQGVHVLPAVDGDPQGLDMLGEHAAAWKADLILMLLDAWPRDPRQLAAIGEQFRIAYWLPVDADGTDYTTSWPPVGALYTEHLAITRGRVIPMTEHAERLCRLNELDPLPYVPHAIDTTVFTPVSSPARKVALKDARGIPKDAFVVGINANNGDTRRKSYSEAFQMFARFHVKHPASVLLVHGARNTRNGLDLDALAGACGISVLYTNQYAYRSGLIESDGMADWYRCLDVLLHVSHGEGFGIAAIEAQACGVPVIATDAEPMRSLAGPGWRVKCQPSWNHLHQAWWHTPLVESGRVCLEAAYSDPAARARRGKDSRAFALEYDIARVMPRWEAVLSALD